MTNGRTRAVLAFLTCLWTFGPGMASASAQSTHYRVLMAGKDIGHLDVARDGAALAIDYDYKQNGRGPTVTEKLTLDAAGFPIDWKISGRSTYGKVIDEGFDFANGHARWHDAAGEGSLATDAVRFYVPQSGSPLALAMLARLLLADADHSMPIFPGGEARLQRFDTRTIEGRDGPQAVTTYRIDGLDINPSYVMLDAQGEFFALADPYISVIRAGYEPADASLRDQVAALTSARLEDIQRQVAHRFTGPVRVRNVHVFDPATLKRTGPVSIVFKDDRVVAIQSSGAKRKGETVIDGAGGTLVPGMIDMHAHLSEDIALLYLAAGVTTVRDLGNNDALLDRLVDRIAKGTIAGPRVIRSGFIEGVSPFSAQFGRLAKTEEEALSHVRWYAERGYRQIKLYSSIDPAWVPALSAEAHRLGMRVTGHVPAFTTADAMIEAGYDEMTHINLVMLPWVMKPGEDTRTLLRLTALNRLADFDIDGVAAQKTIGLMVDRKIAINPTLGIFEGILLGRNGEIQPGFTAVYDHMPISFHRQLRESFIDDSNPDVAAAYRKAFDTIMRTSAMMRQKGIVQFPGTDMGIGSPFGFSRELELFEKVGYSAPEVLRSATLGPAKFMEEAGDLGTIAPGRPADFLLVRGDPTRDISAIRSVAMVVANGTAYFPAEIYEHYGVKPFAPAPAVTRAGNSHAPR